MPFEPDPEWIAEIEAKHAAPEPLHPPFEARDCALGLTPLQRESFTWAALDLAAARYGADSSLSEQCERPYLAACEAALAELDALFDRHVVGDHVPEGELPGVPAPSAAEEASPSAQRLAGMARVVAGWRREGAA